MAVSDANVFPGFLTPVLTQLFFPKPPTTFLTCFCRGERQTYARKKVRLNRESNSQPPGHESDTLGTTEPPGRVNSGFEQHINNKEVHRKAYQSNLDSQCPDGWLTHADKCYHFSHDKETWVDAQVSLSVCK